MSASQSTDFHQIFQCFVKTLSLLIPGLKVHLALTLNLLFDNFTNKELTLSFLYYEGASLLTQLYQYDDFCWNPNLLQIRDQQG